MTDATLIGEQASEALLHDLVTIPSPSQGEADAARWLVDWMVAHGYDRAEVDAAGNAVGIIGRGPREVVLLGHIDTFGGTLPVRLDGRSLYGRGTVDAKGPLCTFAVAAAQSRLADDLRVIVIGAVEEEAPSSKGAHFAATYYHPDLCLIGEPSRWDRVTLGYKGRLQLRWRWEGPLAHSASRVPSPAEHAVAYWQRAEDYVAAINAGREDVFSRLDITLQAIHSGHDGVQGWAEAVIGFRLPPNVDPGVLAAALPPVDGATCTAFGHERAFVAAQDSALSRALRGAIRANGGTPRFVYKTGTSDMNIVGPIWQCPIAAYGPGDSALDHTPDEYLDLDEYQRAILVLTGALERL